MYSGTSFNNFFKFTALIIDASTNTRNLNWLWMLALVPLLSVTAFFYIYKQFHLFVKRRLNKVAHDPLSMEIVKSLPSDNMPVEPVTDSAYL